MKAYFYTNTETKDAVFCFLFFVFCFFLKYVVENNILHQYNN